MLREELGLNWLDYGARFYDGVIGRFHTLDPLAEKYLSNTPYNYGAYNPILLIDVNDDSVKYTNESTKNFINQFIQPTRVNKRRKEVKNNLYNEEFDSIIQELDKHERVYEFSDQFSSENQYEAGAITTDGDKISVGFTEPKEEFGSKSNALFEETYHALQVKRGTLKIQKTGNSFGFSGNLLEAEYDAKVFAAKAPLTRLSYLNPKGMKMETQMSLISTLDPIKGRYYLTYGCTKEYSNSSGLNYQVIYAPPYLNLKRR